MKLLLKKAVAAALSVSMLASVGTVAAFAQTEEAAADNSYYKGVFYYRPGLGEIAPLTDSIDYYIFSDDFFRGDSRVYNDHLSTLSMCLGEASVSSTREPFTPEGYKNKSRDVVAFLEDNGFGDIQINQAYSEKPTKDSVGVVCSHKQIVDGDKEYALLTIIPRSAGYEAEWGNNFVLGEDGDAQGFDGCAVKCLAFAKDYIADKGIEGDIKVWISGYSRGAAISNLMAKRLIDAPKQFLGEAVELTPDNLYAYTFGTPSGADVDNDPRNERYAGIFNSYADTEISSSMAPVVMGFGRYGTDNMFLDDSREEEVLKNLEICNKMIYGLYLDGAGSNSFSPKKLGFTDGSVGMVNDEDSYIPASAREFLKGLGIYLNQVSGGRENFARVYEQPFSDFLAYYESLTGDNASAFTSGLTGHKDTLSLVVGMYAYFMNTKKQSTTAVTEKEARAKAEELAAVAAAGDEDTTGIGAADIAKAAAKLPLFLAMKPEHIRPIVAKYLGNVLNDAMSASGATQAQIDALCNDDSLNALVHLISHLLLGNIWQSDEIRPLKLDNEQIKNAATLIGNFQNIMADHANEVIISWLRTYDSNFADYQSLTEAQIAGYRRVKFQSESAINGEIINGSGETVGVITDGVLSNVTDKWVGFTTTDDGGFFRLPFGGTYQIKVNNVTGSFSAVLGEYDCYTARTSYLFNESALCESECTAVLTVPEIDMEAGMAPGMEYALTIEGADEYQLGDADKNGVVNILDITLIQRTLAGMVELDKVQRLLADVDGDGQVTIQDATAIQIFIAEYDENYEKTGEAFLYHS